jgi:hypothetical protein
MKNLSRVLFFSLLALITTQTFAQKFGIQAGLNLATMLSKDDEFTYSEEMDYKMIPGFNAGVTFEMGLGDLIAVEVGLIADSKGFKIEEGDASMKVSALYADIPILVKVGPSFGPIKVFGAAGPYVGIGLTGKYKLEYEGESETEDIEWGSGEDADVKRLDFGAKFGVGAEVSGLTFGVYYALGLANIAADTEGGYMDKNRVLSISVGYKFGK